MSTRDDVINIVPGQSVPGSQGPIAASCAAVAFVAVLCLPSGAADHTGAWRPYPVGDNAAGGRCIGNHATHCKRVLQIGQYGYLTTGRIRGIVSVVDEKTGKRRRDNV